MGEWKQGLYHGKGEYISDDGSIYVGDFQKGTMYGYGIFQWPSENNIPMRYEGEWKEGRRNGIGKMVFRGGKIRQNGIWSNGVFVCRDLVCKDKSSRYLKGKAFFIN